MTLQSFLFTYGINKTTNFELKDIAKQSDIKVKILILKQCEKRITNAIINFQNSTETGTHWVALSNTDKLYYFDSYGIPPIKEVEDL